MIRTLTLIGGWCLVAVSLMVYQGGRLDDARRIFPRGVRFDLYTLIGLLAYNIPGLAALGCGIFLSSRRRSVGSTILCVAAIIAILLNSYQRGGGYMVIVMLGMFAVVGAIYKGIAHGCRRASNGFKCDDCGKDINVRNAEYVGDERLCSQCAGRDTREKDVPPPKPGKVRVICEACSTPLNVPDKMLGKTAVCPKCGDKTLLTPDEDDAPGGPADTEGQDRQGEII